MDLTTFVIIYIIIGIICGVFGANIAYNRNRSYAAGFWFGFLMGPIGLAILGLLSTPPRKSYEKIEVIDRDALDENWIYKSNSCPKCGKDLAKGSKYCSICGERIIEQTEDENNIENYCRNCGEMLNQMDIFCRNCGVKIINDLNISGS